MIAPGFMTEKAEEEPEQGGGGGGKGVGTTLEHAPFFSPDSLAGRALSSFLAPALASTIALGASQKALRVPYAAAARLIADIATGQPAPGGRPLADYNEKRVGLYRAA